LPIPSPASGFTYTFDRTLGVYSRSAQSFGPILSERAETIGKDKFLAGFSFQGFHFETLDDFNLNRVPVVFQHIPNPTNPEFARDVITTENFLDIKIGQATAFFTYGLHDRIDVSVAIPMVTASLTAQSDATIRRIGTNSDPTIHTFEGGADRAARRFSGGGTANGLGDLTVRLKATALAAKGSALAVGIDSRLPTGDAYDFLGSGALGVKPFVAYSHQYKRFSPHVNVAYQWNGKSVLAGNVTTGFKSQLPDQLFYAAGFDLGVTGKFTLAADFLGQRILDAARIVPQIFTASNGAHFHTIGFQRKSVDITNGSIGFKVNPVGQLLVSFNTLIQLNEGGLRDRITPLIGISYTF
jgi:hypothetical protein